MQEYKLIDKFDGYKLLDRNGQVIYVQTDDVKKQLSLGNVRIYGLKLSESGRLLKETPEEIQGQKPINQTIYGININIFEDRLDNKTRPNCTTHSTPEKMFISTYRWQYNTSLMDTDIYWTDKAYRQKIDYKYKALIEMIMKENNLWYNKYFEASFSRDDGVEKESERVRFKTKITQYEKLRDGFITVVDPSTGNDVEVQATVAFAIGLMHIRGYSRAEAEKEAIRVIAFGLPKKLYTKRDVIESIKKNGQSTNIREGDIAREQIYLLQNASSILKDFRHYNATGYNIMEYDYKQRNLMI